MCTGLFIPAKEADLQPNGDRTRSFGSQDVYWEDVNGHEPQGVTDITWQLPPKTPPDDYIPDQRTCADLKFAERDNELILDSEIDGRAGATMHGAGPVNGLLPAQQEPSGTSVASQGMDFMTADTLTDSEIENIPEGEDFRST